MSDYSKGKIYGLYLNDELRYIGSTILTLKKRKSLHFSQCKKEKDKNRPLFKLLNENDRELFEIKLLEEYPCKTSQELQRKEGEYIINNNIHSLENVLIAGRTTKEWREDNKEYRKFYSKLYIEKNKEKIQIRHNIYNKNYYEKNKEKIKIDTKNYKKNNKDKVKEAQKIYNENNKEKLLNYQIEYRKKNIETRKKKDKIYYDKMKEKILLDRKNERIDCECGINIRKDGYNKHIKSKQHLIKMNK